MTFIQNLMEFLRLEARSFDGGISVYFSGEENT